MCSRCSERGRLTSAARYRGVQPGALGDVKLGQLLCAGGVNAHGVRQVSIGGSTPGGKGKRERKKDREIGGQRGGEVN